MINKPTHKMVDGKRVELTEYECTRIMQEWEENEKKSQEEWEIFQKKQQHCREIQAKLSSITGISIEDLKNAILS